MNEDDKTVYVASQQFSALVERMDAIPIYQATDRHGLLECAAQLKQPQGWDTYLTLGMWEVDQPETIGGAGLGRAGTSRRQVCSRLFRPRVHRT